MVLCFNLWLKVLITHWCFSYCWKVLAQHQDLLCSHFVPPVSSPGRRGEIRQLGQIYQRTFPCQITYYSNNIIQHIIQQNLRHSFSNVVTAEDHLGAVLLVVSSKHCLCIVCLLCFFSPFLHILNYLNPDQWGFLPFCSYFLPRPVTG